MVGASISMLLANTIQLIEGCSMALNKGDLMKHPDKVEIRVVQFGGG
jgi:hypothetical protein